MHSKHLSVLCSEHTEAKRGFFKLLAKCDYDHTDIFQLSTKSVGNAEAGNLKKTEFPLEDYNVVLPQCLKLRNIERFLILIDVGYASHYYTPWQTF